MIPQSLAELRETIRRERRFVDKKTYSHNIISLCLANIADAHGQAEANRAIRDFKLETLGWSEHAVTSQKVVRAERGE